MKSFKCLSIKFADSKKVYSYLTDDLSIEKGDFVIVPAISDTVVKVVDTGELTEDELPVALHKMKEIKRLYRKKKDTHYERPVIADMETQTDDPAGKRQDLFKMLEGVEHWYHECLTEEEIKTYEEKNSISLPLEYRRFLKEIGNGIRFVDPNPKFRNRCGRIQYREVFGIDLKKSKKHYKFRFPFGEEGYDITRGQVVTFLWRAAGCPEPAKNTQTFKDVPTSHSFYKAIQWASEQGITGGYTGAKKGYFGPRDNCTRGHCVTFLYRMLAF